MYAYSMYRRKETNYFSIKQVLSLQLLFFGSLLPLASVLLYFFTWFLTLNDFLFQFSFFGASLNTIQVTQFFFSFWTHYTSQSNVVHTHEKNPISISLFLFLIVVEIKMYTQNTQRFSLFNSIHFNFFLLPFRFEAGIEYLH